MSHASPNLPLPAVEPLELLYVTNGSLLTADRWWQAHHYYQHRQNLHYQSLQQPGIVHGLGVRCTDAPDTVSSELRDHRWIEIQPGIAIDLVGNPIVVDQPVTFRVTSTVIDHPVMVYIVLAYVDPKTKQWQGIPAAVVREEFRINERTTPPGPDEIELCRIQLTSNAEPLHDAANVLAPLPQALDLRDRQRVQARSQQPIQVGLISQQQNPPLHHRLMSLLQAVGGLYPPLAGSTTVQPISLMGDRVAGQVAPTEADFADVALLVLPYADAIALNEPEIEHLAAYIARGSTLLIEYTDEHSNLSRIQELYSVQAEIQTAIDDLEGVQPGTELSTIRAALIQEQQSCETALSERLAEIRQPIQHWGQRVHAWQDRLAHPPIDPAEDPLTQFPFLFDQLPQVPTGPIHLMMWDSLILVIGTLSAAWTRQQFDQPLPRSTLRSAQEFGINILHQASLRQQLIRAQAPTHPG